MYALRLRSRSRLQAVRWRVGAGMGSCVAMNPIPLLTSPLKGEEYP
jgi:hypothetical protein